MKPSLTIEFDSYAELTEFVKGSPLTNGKVNVAEMLGKATDDTATDAAAEKKAATAAKRKAAAEKKKAEAVEKKEKVVQSEESLDSLRNCLRATMSRLQGDSNPNPRKAIEGVLAGFGYNQIIDVEDSDAEAVVAELEAL